MGQHGLKGQKSNNSMAKERALFIQFVKNHRSPTGRTQDATGRYHGAEFYLESKLTTVRTQSGRATPDESVVLECVFNKGLAAEQLEAGGAQVPYRAPSGSSIALWFAEDFGIKSEHGHTTIFPHKSDACAVCVYFDTDISSTEMSIKRHMQQSDDAGSIDRQASALSQSRPPRSPCGHPAVTQ